MTNKPEVYICIYERLVTIVEKDGTIPRYKMLDYLGRIFHIPKPSRNKVIKELEAHGLVREIDKFKIQLIK